MAENSSEEIFRSCESNVSFSPKMTSKTGRPPGILKNVSKARDMNSNAVIRLPDKNEFTVGRWPKADVFLTQSDNMISRRHATVRYADDTWTITDENSVNGIFINGSKIVPNEETVMNDKDLIQFGVSPGMNLPSRFLYQFRCVDCDDILNSIGSPPSKKRKIEYDNSALLLAETLRKQLAEKEAEAAKKLQEQEDQLRILKNQLHEKEVSEASAHEEMQRKEAEMQNQMEATKTQLEEEMKNLEDKMKAQFEKELQEKEAALSTRLSSEKEALLAAKKKVEEDLQKEMEAKLEAKDNQLQEELEKEKSRLEKVIQTKELEQKMLESELSLTKQESLKFQTEALKEKESTLSNITELLETELQCAICNELFIEAMSLNCSHSYCTMCIEEWIKKKPECPICRTRITSRIRSIVLDNYIDRMVEHLSDDMKQQRQALLDDRKKQKAEKAAKAAPPPVPVYVPAPPVRAAAYGVRPPPPVNRGGHRPPRGRNNRGRGAARGAPIQPRPAAPAPAARVQPYTYEPRASASNAPPVSASSNRALPRTSLMGTSADTAIVLGERPRSNTTPSHSPVIDLSDEIPVVPEPVGHEIVIGGTQNQSNSRPIRNAAPPNNTVNVLQRSAIVVSSGNEDGSDKEDDLPELNAEDFEDEMEEEDWEDSVFRRQRRRRRPSRFRDSDDESEEEEDEDEDEDNDDDDDDDDDERSSNDDSDDDY